MTLVIGAPSTVHIEGCEWLEISALPMEAVKTGGHRCEYRTSFDDLAFEILLEQDLSLIEDLIEPQLLDRLNEVASLVKEYPRGDSIYLTLTSIAFSSSESHTGDQSGEFEIHITWD